MDHFVQNKLTEWGLSEYMEKFKDEKISKESLFRLNDKDIAELFPKIGERSIFRSRLDELKNYQTNQETTDFSAQEHEKATNLDEVLPSTSSKAKRKLDVQGESPKHQPLTKRQRDSEERILSKVKDIMTKVSKSLHGQDKLSTFLKNKIDHLGTDKKEIIGVFGRTGAGKSSLINAIIDEKNLLPSGSVRACTSVMIKVEANMCSSKYEAEIEFIKKEEWKNELWPLEILKEGDDDYHEMAEKLSALYGNIWKGKSLENLLEPKYFRNIPEFFEFKKKSLTCDTAQDLNAELFKYTKDGPNQDYGNTVQQWYWPLVKCVTVRVPNNDLLQHVTLVDLPGNGDCNRSRNKMWKQIVGDCSTVWIVAEITRAASETEAWEILEKACGLIGNGGQSQRIHFICTKSDPSDDRVTNNKEAKEEVKNKFQTKMTKHFSEDCFKVFTVSAQEFLKSKRVKEDDNEIPKLQDFLKNLNECHSETFIYVSGAYGILSLIEGAKFRKQGVDKADDVCKVLEKNLNEQLNRVKTAVEEAIQVFEQCLSEGVKNSKTSEDKLKSFLDRDKQPSFFKTLQSLVKKDGIHTTKKGEQINLNMMLASCLTDSIDEKFRKTFPNNVKGGSFNGVIRKFSLGTKSLIRDYKDFRLQLTFLQTEEDKIKAHINKIILKQKKIIYNSLLETIEGHMKKGYKDAANSTGDGALKNTRKKIETNVKKKMYEDAKVTLLKKMNVFKAAILKILKDTMEYSIKHSLKTDACHLPDVSKYLQSVKQHYHELKRGQDEEKAPR